MYSHKWIKGAPASPGLHAVRDRAGAVPGRGAPGHPKALHARPFGRICFILPCHMPQKKALHA